jgi:16S rRNA (adenine1518-N6/adenine1519-N6)-dimethyltransferase
VRPTKARGQNFIVQQSIAQQIVGAAGICADDTIIEIGPGLGILTEQIIAAGPRHVTLVEVDSRLAAMLRARFGDDERITILNRDFLKLSRQDLAGEGLKVIGNLPFAAATAILRQLCDFRESIARIVLMFQREVGERIRALPGARNYGALSVLSALYWRIDGHFRIAAGSFHPRPKVDAEVLVMTPHVVSGLQAVDEAGLRTTIHAAFSAPRKTIRNSLAGGLGVDTETVEAALQRIKLDPSLRPAMLNCSQLIALAGILRPAITLAYRA